jgi:hypothetical protein
MAGGAPTDLSAMAAWDIPADATGERMETFGWRWPRLLTAATAVLLLWTEPASAETVIARRRLGNNAEAMTYDPVNDRAVVMDGDDVVGVALNPLDAIVLATMRNDTKGIKGVGFRKLFDVLALPLQGRQPKGIGYVPTQHRYYFIGDEVGGTGTIFSTDEEGHPRPSLPLRNLAAPVDFWESIAWIPPGAPAHGGTLAILGSRNSEFNISHVYFVRLDGTVEEELIPQPGTALETYLCGLSYWPDHPSTLLLTDCFSGIFGMDLRSGVPVGAQPLAPLPDTSDSEGLIVRRGGSILASGYQEGRLFAYDGKLNRTPADDKLFVIGIGASVSALTWNYDAGEFIALSPVRDRVLAVSSDLRSSRHLFEVAVTNEVTVARGLTYLGSNQLGISSGFPRGIDIAQVVTDDPNYPNGRSISRLVMQGPAFPDGRAFIPQGFSLLNPNDPTTYVLRAVGDTAALKVVTTTGGTPDATFYRDGLIPVRLPDIPLSSPTSGIAAQVFDDGSGPKIFTGAEIYGVDGTLIHRIDWQQLGLVHPASNGVWLGGNTFATVDGLTSTVVIYSVP